MTLLAVVLLTLAAVLQALAAYLAVRALPHSGPYRFLWIALSLALVLMVPRRVAPLLALDREVPDPAGAALALAISALLAFSMIGLARMLRAIHASQQELARLATTDPLTGVANRRTALDAVGRELQRAARTGRPVALLMIDLDHFKAINDRHGHPTGDDVLVAIAARCRARLRAIDACGRIGGEEFIVLLPETDVAGALASAERLRQAIDEAPLDTRSGPVRVTISVGIAVHDRAPGATNEAAAEAAAQALLARADAALYRAKADGRNRIAVEPAAAAGPAS